MGEDAKRSKMNIMIEVNDSLVKGFLVVFFPPSLSLGVETKI